MAYIATENHSPSIGAAPAALTESHETTAQNIVISPAGMTEIPVPGQGFVTNAVMTQEGSDLILESPDGITIVIEDYFSAETPPNLISPDGKVLTPALVKSFIQASTDFAEDKTAMNDTTPVGQVDEVNGHATVTHANGSHETISKGTPIYEGDVVETDEKGAVNIKFADESSFAVSNNAKMAIDEFVFDTASNNGENKFSMLRGLFVYTSGLVGREDPDDVQINTPVGSIGIRGTIITGSIPADGSTDKAQISVIEGAIVIHPLAGDDITLSKQFETVQIDTSAGTTTNVGVLTQSDMAETFNVLRTVAPTLFSAMDEAQHESTTQDNLPAGDPDTTPQDTSPPEAPTEQPSPDPVVVPTDPIQLNLLPDYLNTDSLKDGTLQSATNDSLLTETASVASLTTTTGTSTVSATAPVTQIVTAADTATTNANTPPVGNPTGPQPPSNVNLTPVTTLAAYTAFEQAGIPNSNQYGFDITRFFSDPEGATLTYHVVGVTGLVTNTALVDVTTEPGRLLFVVDPALPADGSSIIRVVASDGVNTSAEIQFTVNGYVSSGLYNGTTTGDTFIITASNNHFSTLGGDDDVTFSGATSNNIVFGGEGSDIATFNSSGSNKFFGDAGDDIIDINSGTNNFASGGDGNDVVTSFVTNVTIFGGEGNDFISMNTVAAGGFSSSTTFLDAGTGFDTLSLTGATLNLSTIPTTSLMNIEKINMAFTGAATVTLDITDILQHTTGKELYIDTDGNDTVTVTNLSAQTALHANGTVIQDGETYNAYTNGDVTLYINQTTTNVVGL